ncbi:MAG: TIGR02266 family protein [Kofleriaceae bacterium]|nr:TIGR02266 family protein [Myxococcales bacterium]MCB9564401.1 TIGR02266 family protein [Kofleriaceae bacterium]MCB9574789.1 TIGR02266 family protein [Kofleriaceae bacterium]
MDDASEADDRRSDARAPIELKVEYRRLNAFFADYTKNISRGGTFIKTGKPLPIGTEFLFKLFVPHLEAPLCIHGEVQWIVSEDDVAAGTEPEAGMGIRFVYRDGDPRDEITRTVERLMVDSLGQRLYTRLMDKSRTGDDPDADS